MAPNGSWLDKSKNNIIWLVYMFDEQRSKFSVEWTHKASQTSTKQIYTFRTKQKLEISFWKRQKATKMA